MTFTLNKKIPAQKKKKHKAVKWLKSGTLKEVLLYLLSMEKAMHDDLSEDQDKAAGQMLEEHKHCRTRKAMLMRAMLVDKVHKKGMPMMIPNPSRYKMATAQ